ncbi:MAG TPA: hypothetical protein VND45_05185 [Thermoanaerobaculia bacterium]|nr:hypothetical protein [Thermoanaerobaculia bacterium]
MESEIIAECVVRENAAALLQQRVGALCAALVECEAAKLTREEIAAVLAPAQRATVELQAVRALPRNAFELVLADGFFDTLDANDAAYVLETVYRALAPGGTFVFTMLDADDPHHPLFDHLSKAPLYPRDEARLRALCGGAGISWQNVALRREERGRALRIEVQKLQ